MSAPVEESFGTVAAIRFVNSHHVTHNYDQLTCNRSNHRLIPRPLADSTCFLPSQGRSDKVDLCDIKYLGSSLVDFE